MFLFVCSFLCGKWMSHSCLTGGGKYGTIDDIYILNLLFPLLWKVRLWGESAQIKEE